MQDVAQLSTLSRETEAPSLSSSSAEKNSYINSKGVNELFGETIQVDYIRCLHAYYIIHLTRNLLHGSISVLFISSKIDSALVEPSLIDSERDSISDNKFGQLE